MPDMSSIRRAYARGGLGGVLTATSSWVGRRLRTPVAAATAPTAPTAPAPKSPTTPTTARTGPSSPPGTVTAQTVDLSRATQFFEARRSGYETLADAVAPFLPVDGVLFDVGANVGFFTKVLVERTGFTGRAHLFEPVPNLADLCTVTAAGLPCQATVHRLGLSDEDTRLKIFVSSDGNLGWNTMVEEKARGKGMDPVEIDVARFDGLGVLDVPDLIKIDVEGAEHRVLTGMLPSLEQWSRRPVILCEIGWGVGHPEWAQELAAFDQLFALGYETSSVQGDPLDVRDIRRTTDVFFMPRHDA